MSYKSASLISKEITLPNEFINYDINNYFVIATLEDNNLTSKLYAPYVRKETGCFNVSVRGYSNEFNTSSSIWFNYIVVINH